MLLTKFRVEAAIGGGGEEEGGEFLVGELPLCTVRVCTHCTVILLYVTTYCTVHMDKLYRFRYCTVNVHVLNCKCTCIVL